MDKSKVISEICSSLDEDNKEKCVEIIREEYPFNYIKYEKRSYTKSKLTSIFIRDGFIDRYSGQRLIFPAVLRILSKEFPEDFPYHSNWKMNECHLAYWELYPTVDHLVPIARGGNNEDDNLVCTSMLRNSAKSNFTLEELGWVVLEPGEFTEWDGLIHWFIDYVEKNGDILKDNYINEWFRAAKNILIK